MKSGKIARKRVVKTELRTDGYTDIVLECGHIIVVGGQVATLRDRGIWPCRECDMEKHQLKRKEITE